MENGEIENATNDIGYYVKMGDSKWYGGINELQQ